MPVFQLFIVDPPTALDLCDAWDQHQDERAGELLKVIHAARNDIKSLALRCLACDLPVLEVVGATFCIACDGTNLARHGVICPQCSRGQNTKHLSELAATSLMQELSGRSGGHAYVGHA